MKYIFVYGAVNDEIEDKYKQEVKKTKVVMDNCFIKIFSFYCIIIRRRVCL